MGRSILLSVSLDQGLKASEREGKPISGKFEIADGALQLSVYTMKGDQFAEVIVDHKSGSVKKSEPITDQSQPLRRCIAPVHGAVVTFDNANPISATDRSRVKAIASASARSGGCGSRR